MIKMHLFVLEKQCYCYLYSSSCVHRSNEISAKLQFAEIEKYDTQENNRSRKKHGDGLGFNSWFLMIFLCNISYVVFVLECFLLFLPFFFKKSKDQMLLRLLFPKNMEFGVWIWWRWWPVAEGQTLQFLSTSGQCPHGKWKLQPQLQDSAGVHRYVNAVLFVCFLLSNIISF